MIQSGEHRYIINKQEFDKINECTEAIFGLDLSFVHAVIDFNRYSLSDVNSLAVTHFDCLSEEEFLSFFKCKTKAFGRCYGLLCKCDEYIMP